MHHSDYEILVGGLGERNSRFLKEFRLKLMLIVLSRLTLNLVSIFVFLLLFLQFFGRNSHIYRPANTTQA